MSSRSATSAFVFLLPDGPSEGRVGIAPTGQNLRQSCELVARNSRSCVRHIASIDNAVGDCFPIIPNVWLGRICTDLFV